jgi:hypothetical protein
MLYRTAVTHERSLSGIAFALTGHRILSSVDRMRVHLDSTAQIRSEAEDCEPASDAIPAEMPLRRTLEWAARLPDAVLPSALMCRYARVANVIAATWEDPKAFRDYMSSLFSNRPVNRRPFPPDVLDELITLQRYFDETASVQ